MNDLKLYDHQKKALEFIIKNNNCALFLEMGLGKTLICLSAINYFIKTQDIKKILIVAPLKVCNTVWKQEADNWNEFKNIKISIATGNILQRTKSLEKEFNILIINNENLNWLLSNYKIIFDMLIIDESSTFKNHQTKRFKSIKKNISKFSRRIILSGTPCPNSYLDLWSQLYILDQGKRLGKNITIYKNTFFDKKDFMGYIWELKKTSKKKIQELISDICLSMKVKDHIFLPPKTHINYYANFSPTINNFYKKMEKDFLIQINKYNITASSVAVCMNKLLQICNGSVYDENKKTIFMHDEKIKLLKKIIEKYKNKNFFIAYHFKSDLEILKKQIVGAVQLSSDGKEMDEWNNNKIKILLAHPKSSCYGLNGYKGGHVVIWYGLSWSLQNYLQFNSRLYRIGQKNNVIIINLLIKGSLDEKIINCLKNKCKNQNDLLKKIKLLGV